MYNKDVENLPNEIWKEVEGYDGRYKVSNKGRVKSCWKNNPIGGISANERFLKFNNTNGYCRVALTNGESIKTWMVHRLVAFAFLESPNADQIHVNHIDGNKLNNSVDNLEWATIGENNRHALKNGLRIPLKGERNGLASITNRDAFLIMRLLSYEKVSNRSLAKCFGVGRSVVDKIKDGSRWSHLFEEGSILDMIDDILFED